VGLFDRFRKQSPKPVTPPKTSSLFDVENTARQQETPQHAGHRAAPPAPEVTPRPGTPPGPPATSPRTRDGKELAARSTVPAGGFGVQQLSRHAQWIGPGTSTTIAGLTIPGGMLYVGRGLSAPRGGIEPAQIDPSLKVATKGADVTRANMGYWPSYNTISPQSRGAYLTWLAEGRRHPHADIGLVFLFLYGLERRALVDVAKDKNLAADLPALRAEVDRLMRLYGTNHSFRGYARGFLNVLDMQLGQEASNTSTPPALDKDHRWEPPVGLKVELGALAGDGKPVPADWALAWAWYHPDIHLRTPATRCTEEFATLFKGRYESNYGPGITVRPGKTKIRVEYYTASSGIGAADLSMSVHDVFTMAVPRKQLDKIVESVTTDLEAYSRYVGRNPDEGSSIAAAALLPDDLATTSPAVTRLVDWARSLADSQAPASGDELLQRWPAKSSDKLAKNEAVAIARLLDRHGLGIEPDVRLGGASIGADTRLIVFHTGRDPQPQSATAAYTSAATLLHLATAVAAADGYVSQDEQKHLINHLKSALDLTDGEKTRLSAHMRWLGATGVKLTGLTKRVETLTLAQRNSIGDLLVAVAAADGVIDPAEVTSLTKIFKLLDLDPADVHSRLHTLLAGARPSPAAQPVTVRPAGSGDPGYAITPPPTSTSAEPAGATETFALDPAVIQARFAETAAVGALLADIFRDDDRLAAVPAEFSDLRPDPADRLRDTSASLVAASSSLDDGATRAVNDATPSLTTAPAQLPRFTGLDSPHSRMAEQLLARDSWTRSELEALADLHHLMPDGALDTINEFAIDTTGEPFLEEDTADVFTINDYARQEIG
jgi:uncharacterized tellurite resistance protein B-like protein